MKIVAIGDIHGRSVWQEIVEREDYDHLVFIGDYFDAKELIPASRQLHNFEEIAMLKRAQPEKVTLLTGNHDYHYLPGATERYGGYQYFSQRGIKSILGKMYLQGCLDMCYIHNRFLFTHAGLTKTWCRNNGIEYGKGLAEQVNQLFRQGVKPFAFTSGKNASDRGNDVTQPPTWVRPPSVAKDGVPGFTQVNGHTRQPCLRIEEGQILIDCLGSSREYLVIEDDKPEIRRL